MPGVVLRITASVGDRVRVGDSLIVLEAMKMEVSVSSPVEGIVGKILVSVGDQVANGQPLAEVDVS